MGFFDFWKQTDINQGVKSFQASKGAVLLDVRTPQEYREGRIPGSRNVPLQQLDSVQEEIEDRDTPLFVYCRSGNRSGQAVGLLESMGYTNVTNIGGILSYTGTIER